MTRIQYIQYICIIQNDKIMKTIEKTLIQFNTLSEVLKATDHEVNAQELLNGRMYLNDLGWTDIELSDSLKEKVASDVSEVLGGRSATKAQVKRSLLHRRPQHWGLERVILENYAGEPFLSYCAGQDYTWETNKIRTYLKNI